MKKKIGLMLLVVVFICSVAMPAMAATSTATAAKKAYKTFLGKRTVSASKVIDIDGNGIPELLMAGNSGGGWYYALCTYNKSTKKVVVLKKVGAGKNYPACFMYNTSKKQVYFNQESTGGANEVIVKVSGTKVTTSATFKSTRNYPKFTYTYKVNGKKVSEKTWTSKRKTALKGFKTFMK